MKILFLSALMSEAREFQKHFHFKIKTENKKNRLYTLEQKNFPQNFQCDWAITGVGPKAVKKFIKFISNQPDSYDLVVLTGYCGALRDEDKAGHVLSSGCVHLWESPESIKLDVPGVSAENQVESCTLAVLADEAMKKDILYQHPGAAFVDMESFYLAGYFKDIAKKIWLVRSVTDGPGFGFPDFKFIQDSWKMILNKNLLGELLVRPMQLYRLFRLLKNIRKAQKGLLKFFRPLIQRGFQGYL